ncbi:tuberin [Pseudomassariella vexata]|uniref:Tuberin n=1 Tax=Pseudomassariella vexata TaxID=1141098 RepID=A0A1Y2EHS7_9PEZI|nr:tuberin [Pseudomassariella vexata]ORY71130.1 tuberin [Pseudomassariella vexata]
MSPSPGDEAQLPQDSRNTGGLASVFKGLAGAAKLTKAAPTLMQTTSSTMNAQIAEQLNDTTAASQGLPPNHMEAFEKLRSGSTSDRVAAADQLRHAVKDYPLNPVLDIWYAAKDMIEPTHASSTRIAGWALLTACVQHPSSTDLERKEYFQTITAQANAADFYLQLEALLALTNHGRDLSGCDYDVFPLLTEWLGMKFDSVRAAKKQASRSKGKAAVSGEDKDFAGLFALTTDVIKFNFSVVDDSAGEALINALLNICMNTSNTEHLRACITVLEAIVTFGSIPNDKLKDCVQVLSSIHCLVPALQKPAWHTLSILSRSHNGQALVRILLDVLNTLPTDADKSKELVREVRGALSILFRLVSKNTEKGYPSIPYSILVDGLTTVVKATQAWKIHVDILRLANALFSDAHGNLNPMIADEDWSGILDVAAVCANSAVTANVIFEEPVKSAIARESSETASVVRTEITKVITRIERLLAEPAGAFTQRQDCIFFFAKIHKVLPDSAASLVLDYFKDCRCCFPSDVQWEANLELVINGIFANRDRSSALRHRAVQVVTEVYDMIELINERVEPDFVPDLVKRLLADVSEETDIEVLEELVSFTAGIANNASYTLFSYIVDTLRGVLTADRLRSPTSSVLAQSPGHPTPPDQATTWTGQTPSNVVVRGYVQIFMRVMNTDVAKASRLYHILVSIAKSNSSETDARLSAMKLLFRLRADWAGRIFVTAHTESAYLASSLYRTEASLARKQAEEAAHPGRLSRGEAGGSGGSSRGVSFGQGQIYPSRPTSSVKGAAPKYQQMWFASDPDALPGPASQVASPVLYSHLPGVKPESGEEAPKDVVLPTSLWLEAILNLFQQGCDWEVYSFVLVHLPSQLSNHGIFKTAVPQLQELRKTLCEQIRMNSFLEPPSASGLRRSDVSICLFHTLTMIMSYHQHFQKPDEDEMVNTFVRGMTWERSAKCCIHALSICCYELPMSTSKALVTILQKMAQIVTQPYVAMHILEFLACLARLPSLYVNFREDEYRIVFGICFRYLQFVREKRHSYRFSSASDPAAHTAAASSPADGPVHPNAFDDLPQYVYALAYHVVTFWFLALKIPDRPNHVGWIARNLFGDADGSQTSEEQAQITIDFMQRVAFADVDESAADPLFTADRYGEIMKKRWLIGNSIVTIEQAVSTGWAQITKRQSSGKSSYIIRESFRPPPAHQERTTNDNSRDANSLHGNSVFPSHLLVQLLSSMPQCTDQARPIPLPDDDAIDRAIRMFDHNSTVDGHKVGVIYIGENQTKESEILANVSGSSDYVDFLNGLGTLTRLKDAKFNAQGLDRQYDTDGQFTFCWRDRVSEIVFHVTTQMPTNLDRDPGCTLKKRHIGNDFVNIIFNDSGLPFKFDTFPSDFNYVNIVITPESRASFVATRQRTPIDLKESFYKVQVMSKPGFPEISPASETKIISLQALPSFIRLLALNASVFSLVWSNREGGEHVSPWRNRLREIKRLREKYGPKTSHSHGLSPSPPGTALGGGPSTILSSSQLEPNRPGGTVRDSFSSLRRSSVATFFSTNSEQNTHSHRSSMLSTAPTENTEIHAANGLDNLVDQVDFSKWA